MRARVFSADLTRAGEELVVSDATKDSGFLRGIAPLVDGGFAVAWVEGSTRNLARRYDASGGPNGDPYEIEGGFGDARAIDGTGRAVVVEEASCVRDSPWGVESFGCIRARRTQPDGTVSDEGFEVNAPNYNYQDYLVDQERPSAAASTGGEFVVVWSEGEDGDGAGIFAKRLP